MSGEIDIFKPQCSNSCAKYARQILQSGNNNPSVLDAIANDFQLLMQNHAIYLKEFFCEKSEFALLQRLCEELEANAAASGEMIAWSKHAKFENPRHSATFTAICNKLAAHFDLDVAATRLNFYADSSAWKPFHHDSHAYAKGLGKEDFTVGLSLGATRALAFRHDKSKLEFEFPQANGDVFAFDSAVNAAFQHGVPRAKQRVSGCRFSIIVWGRRRKLTSVNAGLSDVGTRQEPDAPPQLFPREIDNDDDDDDDDDNERVAPTTEDDGDDDDAADSQNDKEESKLAQQNAVLFSMTQVLKLVNEFVFGQTQEAAKQKSKKKKKAKARVQGGWARKR